MCLRAVYYSLSFLGRYMREYRVSHAPKGVVSTVGRPVPYLWPVVNRVPFLLLSQGNCLGRWDRKVTTDSVTALDTKTDIKRHTRGKPLLGAEKGTPTVSRSRLSHSRDRLVRGTDSDSVLSVDSLRETLVPRLGCGYPSEWAR